MRIDEHNKEIENNKNQDLSSSNESHSNHKNKN